MARPKDKPGEDQEPIATVLEAATTAAETVVASQPTASHTAPDPEAGNAPQQDGGRTGGGAKPDWVETRDVTVTGVVKHDGTTYAAGATIELAETQFEALRKAGLTVQARWDDCL